MTRVRGAAPADARAIAEIHVRGWQAAYVGLVPEDYLASLSVDRYAAMWQARIEQGEPQLLVAVDTADIDVLGWIAFGASRDDGAAPDVAEVWAIYVAPAQWSRGIGQALWAAARAQLHASGFRSVTLWAFPQNERAARYYRALGFAVEPGSTKQFELGGTTLDEIRYARTLEVAAR